MRQSLTVAFSKPFVNGVQWTGSSDGPVEYNYVGDGLFHRDQRTPRPSLEAIGEAIRSWTTHETGSTDASGALSLHGYGGDYQLTITTSDGRTLHGRVHVTEQQANQTSLVNEHHPAGDQLRFDRQPNYAQRRKRGYQGQRRCNHCRGEHGRERIGQHPNQAAGFRKGA